MMEPVKLNLSLRESDKLNLSLQDRDRLEIIASNIIHYASLIGKPSINGVILVGDKTSSDLGIELPVHQNTTADWNANRYLVAQENHIYVYTDYIQRYDRTYSGIKIGDGLGFLIDAPFINGPSDEIYDHIDNMEMHITNEEREFWNNKITCYISENDKETLILTKSLGV